MLPSKRVIESVATKNNVNPKTVHGTTWRRDRALITINSALDETREFPRPADGRKGSHSAAFDSNHQGNRWNTPLSTLIWKQILPPTKSWHLKIRNPQQKVLGTYFAVDQFASKQYGTYAIRKTPLDTLIDVWLPRQKISCVLSRIFCFMDGLSITYLIKRRISGHNDCRTLSTHKTHCFLPSMPKTAGILHLLVLKDKQVPSRGSWVVYPSFTEIGFTACHEIQNDRQEPRVMEEICLRTIIDVRTFCSNLIRHGWTTSNGVN